MNFEEKLLRDKIKTIDNSDINVVVLKGFSMVTYHSLMPEFNRLEPDTIFDKEGKIILKALNETLFPIIGSLSQIKGSKIGLMLFESFLLVSKNLNLDTLKLNFNIIYNNVVELYENPTNEQIQDYENLIDKNLALPDNDLVSVFYSSCSTIGIKQYIEYVDGLEDEFPQLKYSPLIEEFEFPQTKPTTINDLPKEAKLITVSHFNFILLKYDILHSTTCQKLIFAIDETSSVNLYAKKQLSIFTSFLKAIKFDYTFLKIDNRLTNTIRPELSKLLKQYWNSDNFRSLQFYNDPDISKELINISQGEIIETIVQQCEKGLNNQSVLSDIFLTAPTGAGKSLLFQLPAIFIANKFNALTIVISPLIALMKDQVVGLKQRGYNNVVCLNSELSLVDREVEIDKIKNGETHILYLSPELLLSYDLSMFLGERKLGLLVIDEAHLVTTWGRDFRVDYWYLGNFIRKIRKYTDHKFPVLAVTATAVYDPNGVNDMVFETLDSLSMDPVIKYLGKVRRDDINFDIKEVQIISGHEEQKIRLTSSRILEYINNNEKTIIYCPWTRQIGPIRDQLPKEVKDLVQVYYGNLDSANKEESYQRFRNGVSRAMISTKAFGMGVDIDDITVVYHHAPSGHLADYVQEIGRLARRSDLIGTAAIDFNKKDLKFTKILFGLSSIKQYQVAMVLDKLNKIYKIKKSRNMLVSVDDFEYIFNFDNVDVEQKVKSALLLLEKDLLNKYRYNVLIVRPKSLFTSAFIKISNEHLSEFQNKYGIYLKPINSKRVEKKGQKVFIIQLDKLWEDKYSKKSFPLVKKEYFDGKLFNEEIPYKPQLKINYILNKNVNDSFNDLTIYFDLIQRCFSQMSGFFSKNDFVATLKLDHITNQLGLDNLFIKRLSDLILSIYSDPGKPDRFNRMQIPSDCFLQSRRVDHEYEYRIINKAYPKVRAMLRQTFYNVFNEHPDKFEQTVFISTDTIGNKNRSLIRLAYIIETFNIGTYEMAGGEVPAIFIRINDPVKINWLSRNDYENEILKGVDGRQKISVKIMEHFFTTKMDNSERWEFIEDFFLGKQVDELIAK
jgi:superfamily II DNA/RNA helicase